MKAEVEIVSDPRSVGYFGEIKIINKFIEGGHSYIYTETNLSKGQLRRKVIQFCSSLNLEVEWK